MAEEFSLSGLSDEAILRCHAQVSSELRRRGICRSSNNPVADYAERIVASALGLELAPRSTAGFDAKDLRGRRYEIKARRVVRSGKATMLSAIRGIEKRHFDFLVAVIFNEDYTVQRAVKIPYAGVVQIAKFRKHVNAHIVMIRDMWNVEGAEDITAKLVSGAVGRTASPAPRTGAELLTYWQGEGLVGTRPEIADGPAHARALREEAQRRARQ